MRFLCMALLLLFLLNNILTKSKACKSVTELRLPLRAFEVKQATGEPITFLAFFLH